MKMLHDVSPYDSAEFLHTPEEISQYLSAVLENHGKEPQTVAKALGVVARAKGMQKIARATGLKRQGLYKSLSEAGNPSFDTVLKVMDAVGVKLTLQPMVSLSKGVAARKKASKHGSAFKIKRSPMTGHMVHVAQRKKKTMPRRPAGS